MTSCSAVRKQISQAAEQRRRQGAQGDRAGGGEHAGAAGPGGAQFVGRQPVQRSRDRPVGERPELREVGQQDQRQRARTASGRR